MFFQGHILGKVSETWLELAFEQALLFGRAKQGARERASERQSRPPLSRFLSRASRATTFHDIPKWRVFAGRLGWNYSEADADTKINRIWLISIVKKPLLSGHRTELTTV